MNIRSTICVNDCMASIKNSTSYNLGSDILVLQGLHFLPKYDTHSIPLMNEFLNDLGPHGFKYTLYVK